MSEGTSVTTEDRGVATIGSVRLLMALGGVAIWLVLAGVVGALHVASSDRSLDASASTDGAIGPGSLAPGEGTTQITDPATGEVIVIDPATGQPVVIDPATGAPRPGGGTGGTAGTATTGGPKPTPPPGDRTGVSATEIKVGIHAPVTFGGAPLNLAEDPLEGIDIYTKFINERLGGINGRKLKIDVKDDRYEATGGQNAGIALIEGKNFIISGTLGVDQINAVAIEANKAKVPYHAAGGHEPDFAKLGLYQISTSYDTHVIQLARWIATQQSLKNLKIGISVLDSPLLLPVVNVFKAEAQRVGLNVASEPAKIQKPTEQSSYSAQLNLLKSQGVKLFIPMQDPISTGRMVGECGADCPWTYTFSNFAHEGDTALALMGGQWAFPGKAPVRGLAGACYYLSPQAYNPAQCAHMDRAHDQWVAINGEDDWVKDGQGGASGYQIVSMLAEALRRAGPDPTRQGYRAAILGYNNFDDLITSPITFAGRSFYSHGSEKMAVYEAQSNQKYKQLGDGLVQF